MAEAEVNIASCLLNVGQVVLGEFSFERVVLGRVVFGASCPVFWRTPYAVKETRPFSCIAVAAIFTCKSFVLLNLTYFAHFINIQIPLFGCCLASLKTNMVMPGRAPLITWHFNRH